MYSLKIHTQNIQYENKFWHAYAKCRTAGAWNHPYLAVDAVGLIIFTVLTLSEMFHTYF